MEDLHGSPESPSVSSNGQGEGKRRKPALISELRALRAERDRRADDWLEVVAALYKAWPDAEDMATDLPNGIVGRIEDLIAERDAALRARAPIAKATGEQS